ncbi:hypothetical protein BC937DRAFT_92535 [Endogone sp. FLAS-F59071]|nr:hypothetical protein BC937DRAFT_92535 [Endogone sp. FLAS-F59071]|eukprot:RUS15376.1 hypothetical protein BC937DRAFT_92535 [Endogone sp. FLAS-F59071]
MSTYPTGSSFISTSLDPLGPHSTLQEQHEQSLRVKEEPAAHLQKEPEMSPPDNLHHPAPLPTPLPSPSASADATEENIESVELSPPSPKEAPVPGLVSMLSLPREDAKAVKHELVTEQSDQDLLDTTICGAEHDGPMAATSPSPISLSSSSEAEPPPSESFPASTLEEKQNVAPTSASVSTSAFTPIPNPIPSPIPTTSSIPVSFSVSGDVTSTATAYESDSDSILPTPLNSPDTSVLSPDMTPSILSGSNPVVKEEEEEEEEVAAAAAAAAAEQSEFDTQINILHHNTFPYVQIDQMLADDPTLLPVLIDWFNKGSTDVSSWLGAANIAVYALEQDVKGGMGQRDTGELDGLMHRFESNMELLKELAEVIDEREVLDDDVKAYREREGADCPPSDVAVAALLSKQRQTVKSASTKLQSEWSGLKHFLASIKKELSDMRQRKELAETMDEILVQIDDLSTTIFQYQEQRLSDTTNDDSTPQQYPFPIVITTSPSSSASLIPDVAAAAASLFDGAPPQQAPTNFGLHSDPAHLDTRTRDDLILMQIDGRAEPLFRSIEQVYMRLTSSSAPADPTGAIKRKHALVQDRWDSLRGEIDELKDDLKEEQWLQIFRQAADQIGSMVEGLDRTVAQCHLKIAEVKSWHAEQVNVAAQYQALHSPTTARHHMLHSPTPQQQGNNLGRLSRNLRSRQSASPVLGGGSSIPRPGRRSVTPALSHGNLSILTDRAVVGTGPSGFTKPPVDKETIQMLTKNFEIKYRTYNLAIDRLLVMLSNHIAQRTMPDVDVQQRYEDMANRWKNLKSAMEDLRTRDLPETERILSDQPVSPTGSGRSEMSFMSAASDPTARRSNRLLSPDPEAPQAGRPRSPNFRKFIGNIRSAVTPSPSPYDDEVRVAARGGRRTPTTQTNPKSALESGWNRPNSSRRTSTPSPAPGQIGFGSGRMASPLSFGAAGGPHKTRSTARGGRTTSPAESRDDSSFTSSPSASNVTSVGRNVYGLGNTSVRSFSSAGTAGAAGGGKPLWNVSTRMDMNNYLTYGPLWKAEQEGGLEEEEERGRRRSKTPLVIRPKTPAGERKDSTLMNPTKSSIYRREQSLPRYHEDTGRGRDRSVGAPDRRDRSVGPFMSRRDRSVGAPDRRDRSIGPFMSRGRERSAGPYGKDERGRDRSSGPYGRDERGRARARDQSAGPYGRDERGKARDKSAGPYGKDERQRDQSVPRYMQSTANATRKSKTPLVQQPQQQPQQPASNGRRSITPTVRPKTPSLTPGTNRPKTPTATRPRTPTWHGERANGDTKTLAQQMQQLALATPSAPYAYPDRDRAVSPTGSKRASKSPSMIPRPRTPQVGSRPTSPSAVEDDAFRPGFLKAMISTANGRTGSPLTSAMMPPPPKLPTEYASIVSTASSQNSALSAMTASTVDITSVATSPVRKSHIPRKSHTPTLNKKSSVSHLFQNGQSGDNASSADGDENPKPSVSSTLPKIFTDEDGYDDYMKSLQVTISDPEPYEPDPRDPLDIALAKVINESPIRLKCVRAPQGGGKYYFGSDLSRKLFMCKLMSYDSTSRNGRNGSGNTTNSKVLVRVGGGWQDLEMFIFDHMDLMMSNVILDKR